MRVAIYSRKSKLSERGDSIRNQIELCRAYIASSFDAEAVVVYEEDCVII